MILNGILICEIILSERIELDIPGMEPKEFNAEARFLASQIDGYYEAAGVDGQPDGSTWVYLRSGKRFCIAESFLEFDAMYTDYLRGVEK